MDIEQLKKDKADLEKKIQGLQRQITNAQIQLYRLDGALGYINDNIKELKEAEDVGTQSNN